MPTALIMGSEETGVRQKTLEICDSVISLSGNTNFKSLNVSVATGSHSKRSSKAERSG